MIILDHCVARYRERSGCSERRSDTWVKSKIRDIVSTGREWEVKPDKRLRQLLMNHCEPASYWVKGGIMVVVAGGVAKTCHTNKCNRFIPKKTP